MPAPRFWVDVTDPAGTSLPLYWQSRGGWLYNVSGFDAVELTLDNGRIYRIGTDEPQQLWAAIESARGKRSTR